MDIHGFVDLLAPSVRPLGALRLCTRTQRSIVIKMICVSGGMRRVIYTLSLYAKLYINYMPALN